MTLERQSAVGNGVTGRSAIRKSIVLRTIGTCVLIAASSLTGCQSGKLKPYGRAQTPIFAPTTDRKLESAKFDSAEMSSDFQAVAEVAREAQPIDQQTSSAAAVAPSIVPASFQQPADELEQPAFEDDDPRPAEDDATSNESTGSAQSTEPNSTDQAASAPPPTVDDSAVDRAAGNDPSTDPPAAVRADLDLPAVLRSTRDFYPEIESLQQELSIADGKLLAAQGSFDTKLKAVSENTPVGFYETYRSNFGVERPTFNGGSVFAGYRFGRGDIEPWYLERNTNELGELKLGANWALLRGRSVDARRIAVWQADLKRNAVEPVVRQQLLLTFRDAEIAYWNWVAAGQVYLLTNQLLDIAKDRVGNIQKRIQAGDLADISRIDNQRSIMSREVKRVKAKAKFDQAAIKLSLYYRDANGQPQVPNLSQVPKMETDVDGQLNDAGELVTNAIQCRPEVRLIDLDTRRATLDLQKAENDLLPRLDASVALSQDFGDPTSASAAASSSTQELFVFFDEKDEFQVDASVSWSQSLQRRKASGKILAISSKVRQLQIKRRFLEQKIEAEVRQNYRLTAAAAQQIDLASQTLELARELSGIARQRYEAGDVDLFEIILREQQELDSAMQLIDSQFNFFSNRANLNASVGCDQDQAFYSLLDQ